MSQACIITGTDTDVGKTVFSAALMLGLHEVEQQTHYWKPVQAGLDTLVDTRLVQKLTAFSDEYFVPETYVFSKALSPHRAAEIDGLEIDLGNLDIPETDGLVLIEGAGGLMVPLTRENLYINQFKRWNAPVILCARTGLGTINHTLLSLEALWVRDIPVLGIAFIGDKNSDNMRTIEEYSGEKILGRLPILEDLNAQTLKQAFQDHFDIGDFVDVG